MTGSHDAPRFGLLARVSRLELVSAGIVAVALIGLAVADRDVLEAPWQSERAIALVIGGTVVAAVALLVMLRLGVPPVVRVLVLGIPFVVTSWWLISPFFTDDVVRERFETSIAEAQRAPATSPATAPAGLPPATAVPGPELLGAGRFVGLAGHRGTGDAGLFRLADGSRVLRLEQLDIDNGPDLQLYLVPGADRRAPADGSHHLGALRGNVGELTYDLPSALPVDRGAWTVLVWCRAFSVEFVAATVTVS